MDHTDRSLPSSASSSLLLAPIHPFHAGLPLNLCVLFQPHVEPGASPFILLRDMPGSRVYLGAICDAAGRIQEWLELWIQELNLKELAMVSHDQPLDNPSLDQRWRIEFERARRTLPETVIVTGMEETHPSPILVKRSADPALSPFALVAPTRWQLCQDDKYLQSLGLPAYSSSSYRYLYDPTATDQATLVLSTAAEAPSNPNVHDLDAELGSEQGQAVFNRQAGLVRVTRFFPLELEEYLQILESRPWNGPAPQTVGLFGIYSALQRWSGTAQAGPFLLERSASPSERLQEIFFLKLSVLLAVLKEVHAYTKAHQVPFLNLTPASFRVSLPDAGEQFPAFWAAKLRLVRPSQGCSLKVRLSERRYFIRLGRTELSPFLPEGLGAHSFGIGSIRIRNVLVQDEGVILEGTLVAEEYLGRNPHDLLWFKLPLGEERLEFFAEICATEIAGPREARFRTVPTARPEAITAALKRAVGTAFQRAPYEIWPLLSSPCDLFSLGVMAIRILLANSQSDLPAILDDVLSITQHFAKDATDTEAVLSELKLLASRDQRVHTLTSPLALLQSSDSPEQAAARLPTDLWLEAVALALRLFPGIGPQSFCPSPAEVPPEALHQIYEQPIQELEGLVLRLRSALVPALAANEEIAGILRDELAEG